MSFGANYPNTRMRRNRKSDWSRRLVRETSLSTNDLILPLFLQAGKNEKSEIKSMPGIFRLSKDLILNEVKKAAKLGIPAIALFPVIEPNKKSDVAKEAYNSKNLICSTIKEIKNLGLNIGIICDVALDPYTSHGHDGIIAKGEVLNDATVEILCKQALAQAAAGCDIVAPSDMMDGRVAKIRKALDDSGFENVQIMSYAAKYASSFYGPFREALGSDKSLGKKDKRSYQMDPANSEEALREVALDISEGADMVIIKPGLPYLDIIYRVKTTFGIPTFAYQVSGEYAMIKAAAKNGWIDEDEAIIESLIAFKRAGANGIITYGAIDIAEKISC